MILNSIKLSNIRSYTTQDIHFPRGTLLLSGDIGSGKSSILQAIDFALFGITKEVTGPSLLRSGAPHGSVELHFTVEEKDITIKRTLKRGKSVTQDSGYLIVDGVTKELTPTELKQFIITTLCYPPELLTKKSLIYRYTVYTPQEEMKHILLTEPSERLDILRKVFGVDKYKRVAENAELFLSSLKQKITLLKSLTTAYDEKKQHLATLHITLHTTTREIENITTQLHVTRDSLTHHTQELASLEQKKQLITELSKELSVVTAHLYHTTQIITHHTATAHALATEITTLESGLVHLNISPPSDLTTFQQSLSTQEQELQLIRNDIQTHKTLINQSLALKEHTKEHDVCPLCKQTITEDHISHLHAQEDQRIATSTTSITTLTAQEQTIIAALATLKKDIQTAQHSLHQQELFTFQKNTLEKRKKELYSLKTTLSSLHHDFEKLTIKKNDIAHTLSPFSSFENTFLIHKQQLDELVTREKALDIQNAALSQTLAHHTSEVKRLAEEITTMDTHKCTIETLATLMHWLTTTFIPLVSQIEQHIMLKVHADFDTFFRKWFALLVDTEFMQVRLDASFNLVIEQNGHDIEYTHLSGGEKTAAALAYRLALNQVINSLVSTIKTKDLLILDEPTDGFSNEQLERIRTVLDELDAHQIIIVSHEEKIESFVEHVIKIRKEDHISRIFS